MSISPGGNSEAPWKLAYTIPICSKIFFSHASCFVNDGYVPTSILGFSYTRTFQLGSLGCLESSPDTHWPSTGYLDGRQGAWLWYTLGVSATRSRNLKNVTRQGCPVRQEPEQSSGDSGCAAESSNTPPKLLLQKGLNEITQRTAGRQWSTGGRVVDRRMYGRRQGFLHAPVPR